MSHSHYSYDRDEGRASFTYDVNRMFERNGMAFELREGAVVRLAPAILQEALASSTFWTGDSTLDELLEVSRQKFTNHSIDVRRESLEKLWDAWERLKTLESHHQAVLSLPADERHALLQRAEAEQWNRDDLREHLREERAVAQTKPRHLCPQCGWRW